MGIDIIVPFFQSFPLKLSDLPTPGNVDIPSKERSHILPGEKEHHWLKWPLKRDMLVPVVLLIQEIDVYPIGSMYGIHTYMDGWLLWFSCRKARYDWRILEDQGPIEKEEHNPLWNSDSKSPEHQSLEDEISYLDLSYFQGWILWFHGPSRVALHLTRSSRSSHVSMTFPSL